MPRTTAARKATTTTARQAVNSKPIGSTILEFVEELPPAKQLGRNASAWLEEAAELKAHKGHWAKLKTFAKSSGAGSLSSAIKAGKLAAFKPAGSFEAVSRTNDDGTAVVFARYVG